MTKIYSALSCRCKNVKKANYLYCYKHDVWVNNAPTATTRIGDALSDGISKYPEIPSYLLNNEIRKGVTIKQSSKYQPFDKNNPLPHYFLYVLKLEQEKYYIGITAKRNPFWRIQQHFQMVGSMWTRLHSLQRILWVIDLGYITKKEAEKQENELTIKYMKKHGKQNVRGGRNVRISYLLFINHSPYTVAWFKTEIIRMACYLLLVAIALLAFLSITDF